MTFKTWDFRGVFEEDFYKGSRRWAWRLTWWGTPKGTSEDQSGLQTGHGRGLAVKLRSGKVQVRSGPGLIHFTDQI